MPNFNPDKEFIKLRIKRDCLQQAVNLIDSFPDHPKIDIPIMGSNRVNTVHIQGLDREEKIKKVYNSLLNYKLNPGF